MSYKISKCKYIFAKDYTPNWSEEKTLCHGHMLLVILMRKKLLEPFMNCKKQVSH